MLRIGRIALLAGVLVVSVVAFTGTSYPTTKADRNISGSRGPARIAPIGKVPPGTVAQAKMPAPSSSTSITITMRNTSAGSTVGAQQLQALVLDCFGGLGGQALTMDSVFGETAPPGGTVTVTTANDTDDAGPAILTYTGFDDGESVAFSVDPDTWDDPSFGATRGQLAGCRVEAVFAGANLRGAGTMSVTGADATRANATQTFP